jgi:hypothetical protein
LIKAHVDGVEDAAELEGLELADEGASCRSTPGRSAPLAMARGPFGSWASSRVDREKQL